VKSWRAPARALEGRLMKRFILGASLGLASVLGVVVAPAYAAEPTPHRIIFATDVCDPVTFNAPPPAGIGPGTCARQGRGVTLPQFLSQVAQLHRAPAWQFAPGTVVATTSDPIQVRNIGGEVHTFTEVAKFGGGFVPFLNDLGGFGPMVPESAHRRTPRTTPSWIPATRLPSLRKRPVPTSISAASTRGCARR